MLTPLGPNYLKELNANTIAWVCMHLTLHSFSALVLSNSLPPSSVPEQIQQMKPGAEGASTTTIVQVRNAIST